jgi:hypothetical protein
VNSFGNGCLGRRVKVGLRFEDPDGGGLRSTSARLERREDDADTLVAPLPASLKLRGGVGSETSRSRGDNSAIRRAVAGGVTDRSSEAYE